MHGGIRVLLPVAGSVITDSSVLAVVNVPNPGIAMESSSEPVSASSLLIASVSVDVSSVVRFSMSASRELNVLLSIRSKRDDQ